MKLAVVFSLLAGSAQALSCVAPDPLFALQLARDDAAPWAVLQGRLDHDGDWKPDLESHVPPAPPAISAWFEGRFLGPEGFLAAWSGPVTLQPECAGPFCAPLPDPGEYLVFARQEGGQIRISLGPCGGSVFPPADAALVARMLACLNGGTCS